MGSPLLCPKGEHPSSPQRLNTRAAIDAGRETSELRAREWRGPFIRSRDFLRMKDALGIFEVAQKRPEQTAPR